MLNKNNYIYNSYLLFFRFPNDNMPYLFLPTPRNFYLGGIKVFPNFSAYFQVHNLYMVFKIKICCMVFFANTNMRHEWDIKAQNL